MGRPKGNTESESIGIRINTDLLHKLEDYANNSGVSRSSVAVKSIYYYVMSNECVECGALNPDYGKMCCSCGALLYSEFEIKEALKSIVRPENSMIYAVNEALRASKEYREKYEKLGCRVSIEPIIDRMKKPTEYRIKLVLTLADGKTKLIPEDHREIIGNGLVVPKAVLMGELERVRSEHMTPELYETYLMVKRFMSEHLDELMPSDKEEKPNHVKEVRKNGKED